MEPEESDLLPTVGADIVFVSSDGVRFGLHSKNLEVGSGGFPPVVEGNGAGLIATTPVPLPEPCDVLEPLFSFLYPEKWPHGIEMYFSDELLDIAEAAEKYQIYGAKYHCHGKLK
ncbi:hypothetical protein EST38_g6812 [Candolleomyces aberdarensis]|uniref:BTB domain-containing protein n=1 Tax=Candolleomyces aberdarensis TaxID=2316362 RepID=A0A4Q2DGR0_9AGAR|nr:hypothetical protein EST38_g6812 [Candolleomyces aberdarensis]